MATKKAVKKAAPKKAAEESARKEGRKKEVVELQGAGFVSAPVFRGSAGTLPHFLLQQSPKQIYNRAQ